MAREFTFVYEADVPVTPGAKIQFKNYLQGLVSQAGMFGDGRSVGLGYEWTTRNGIDNYHLTKLTRMITKAMRAVGMIGHLSHPYWLGQRIRYVSSGDAKGTITIRED